MHFVYSIYKVVVRNTSIETVAFEYFTAISCDDVIDKCTQSFCYSRKRSYCVAQVEVV